MAELARHDVSLVGCFASKEACDALERTAQASVFRIAEDEVMLIGASADSDVRAAAQELDPEAVVLDVTDGWTAWSLSGDDVQRAFCHVSELRLPDEGFIQGEVAGVPARVAVSRDRLDLFVEAMWGEHLRDRLSRCPGVSETAP